MSVQSKKEYIPIFIGSTYEDLKEYRHEVQTVLIKYETIIKGMEFFGSTANTPLNECLKKIRESQIYIGIFAHRYGSVDEETGKSFTQIEYEEAQKLNLPSLIYIIDDNQPVPPKYIDEGEKKEKLAVLKALLKKKHNLSIFTTPDNLSKKLSEDLLNLFIEIGLLNKSTNINSKEEDNDDISIFRRFLVRPKGQYGKVIELIVEINKNQIASAWHYFTDALDLEFGNTILFDIGVLESFENNKYIVEPPSKSWHNDKDSRIVLLAQGSEAVDLENIVFTNKKSESDTLLVRVRVKLIYGIDQSHYDGTENSDITKSLVCGLLLIKVLEVYQAN